MKSVAELVAEVWEQGARWAWERRDYTEEELQEHLDRFNPYLNRVCEECGNDLVTEGYLYCSDCLVSRETESG